MAGKRYQQLDNTNYCQSEKAQCNDKQAIIINGLDKYHLQQQQQQQQNHNNNNNYKNAHNNKDTNKDSYIDISKLTPDSKSLSPERLEQSYERDSRWKPHLSWSFLSWSLQQRMDEQAAQRELTWQKIADKLGPLLISDGAYMFNHGDYTTKSAEERAYERVPFISHNHQANYQSQRHVGVGRSRESITTPNQYTKKEKQHHYYNTTKPSGRFLTVSGILVSLIVLLFTIVILMALGIIPYTLRYRE